MAVLDWLQQLLGGGGSGQPSGQAMQQNPQTGAFEPYTPSPVPSALDMLANLTGATDMQQAYQAAGRGEYLPALGQGAWGAGQAASLAVPALRSGMAAVRAGAPVAREMAGAFPALMRDEFGGIKAYHGSPYDFERFDPAKIGTGEGAQTYGHGLYFAEHEPVARGYRDQTSLGQVRAPSSEANLAEHDVLGKAARHLYNSAGDYDLAAQRIRQLVPDADATLKSLQELKQMGAAPHPGHMYEVDINVDPQRLLDWDKPLSEQGQPVRDAIRQFYGQPTIRDVGRNPNLGVDLVDVVAPGGGTIGAFDKTRVPTDPAALQEFAMKHDPRAGAAIYESSRIVPGEYRDPAAASQTLNRAGIPGIRYLDQGSRGVGQGTSNYVMFDPALIEIRRKYGLLGPVAGAGLLGAAEQQ